MIHLPTKKILQMWLTVIICGSVAPAALAQLASVVNPGFEDANLAGWTINSNFPVAWWRCGSAAGCGANGNSAGGAGTFAATGGADLYQDVQGAQAGRQYTMSFSIKTEFDANATNRCFTVAQVFDSGNQSIAWITPPVEDRVGQQVNWTYTEHTFTAPPAADRIRLHARCEAGNQGRNVYWDNVSVWQSGNGKKNHFGHWVRVFKPQHLDAAKVRTGVTGVMPLYNWKELEKRWWGDYDFTQVRADFEEAKAEGKYFMIQIGHREFKYLEKPLPDFYDDIQSTYILGAGTGQGTETYCAHTWKTKFVNRYKALLDAIAAEFGGDPFFVGVSTQETSLGFNNIQSMGYTPQGNANAWADILAHGDTVLGDARMLFSFNFQPVSFDPLRQLVGDIATNGSAIVPGGPDLDPDESSGVYRNVHQTQMQWRDYIDTFVTISGDPDICTHYTKAQMHDFARDSVEADYLFWNGNAGACWPNGMGGAYWYIDNNPYP